MNSKLFFVNYMNTLNKIKAMQLLKISLSKCIQLPGIFSSAFLVNVNTAFHTLAFTLLQCILIKSI